MCDVEIVVYYWHAHYFETQMAFELETLPTQPPQHDKFKLKLVDRSLM